MATSPGLSQSVPACGTLIANTMRLPGKPGWVLDQSAI